MRKSEKERERARARERESEREREREGGILIIQKQPSIKLSIPNYKSYETQPKTCCKERIVCDVIVVLGFVGSC